MKVAIWLIAIPLLCSFTHAAQALEEVDGYLGAKFGMNPEQVQKIFPGAELGTHQSEDMECTYKTPCDRISTRKTINQKNFEISLYFDKGAALKKVRLAYPGVFSAIRPTESEVERMFDELVLASKKKYKGEHEYQDLGDQPSLELCHGDLLDFPRFRRHISTSSLKLLECQRAQLVEVTVPADSIVKPLDVIKHI